MIDPQKAFLRDGRRRLVRRTGCDRRRGRSWALLALLGWAETRGALTINRREAIASVHNKAQMSIAFTSAGIPVPQTFFEASATGAGNSAILLPDHFEADLRRQLARVVSRQFARRDGRDLLARAGRAGPAVFFKPTATT